MLLFKIFKIRRMLREAEENPSKFAKDEIGDMIRGVFILPFIVLGAVIILFFIGGYTEIFGKSFIFSRILFWISLVGGAILFLIARKTIKIAKKLIDKVKN